MQRRDVRYQAAIVHNDHVLLLKVVDIDSGAMFWLLPGGGREGGESEEVCLQREVCEETELEVTVVRPLFEMPDRTSTAPPAWHTAFRDHGGLAVNARIPSYSPYQV